jgi:ATP-binding cassette subfamily B multidrug efflux pump
LAQYKTAVIIVFIFAVASTAANIAGPKLLGNATTKLFEGVMAQLSMAPVKLTLTTSDASFS